jgi:hypothetical protein
MRDEGMFLLEWVAYHQVIGFDRVVICSNDCADGSDLLLQALDAAGVITHLPNPIAEGERPQQSGIRRAFAHLEATDAQWLCHIDADEYLNIGHGAGRVADLLAVAGKGHVIALPWRLFGDSGHDRWPGATLPHFTRCEGTPDPKEVSHKSMYRFRRFAGATDHMPVRPRIPRPVVRSAAGRRLLNDALYGEHHIRYRPAPRAWRPEAACINHYATRSTDAFLLRGRRGRGWHSDRVGKYALGGAWHLRANQNGGEDRSILRHWPATEARMAELRALPGVALAEAACRDWFMAETAKLDLPVRPLTGAQP